MNPAYVLPARADLAADEQLERRDHLLERPALRIEHHPDTQDGDPHAMREPMQRRLFPIHAELSEEIVAGRAVFGQFLIAGRAVVTDGRGVHEDLDPAA